MFRCSWSSGRGVRRSAECGEGPWRFATLLGGQDDADGAAGPPPTAGDAGGALVAGTGDLPGEFRPQFVGAGLTCSAGLPVFGKSLSGCISDLLIGGGLVQSVDAHRVRGILVGAGSGPRPLGLSASVSASGCRDPVATGTHRAKSPAPIPGRSPTRPGGARSRPGSCGVLGCPSRRHTEPAACRRFSLLTSTLFDDDQVALCADEVPVGSWSRHREWRSPPLHRSRHGDDAPGLHARAEGRRSACASGSSKLGRTGFLAARRTTCGGAETVRALGRPAGTGRLAAGWLTREA